MNKLLTKIVGVVLGTTMAVGVGVGVAVNNSRDVVDSQVFATNISDSDLDTTHSVTVDFSTVYNADTAFPSSYSLSSDFTATPGGTGTAMKYYKSGTAVRVYSGNTLTISSSTKKLGKIVFELTQNDFDSASVNNTDGYSSGTWIAANKTTTSVTFTRSTNSQMRFRSITVVPVLESPAVPLSTLELKNCPSKMTTGDEVTLSYKGTDTNGSDWTGSVTYLSSDSTVASISGSKLTAKKAGTTSISVKAAGAGTSGADVTSTSISVTVSDPVVKKFYEITSVDEIESGKEYLVGASTYVISTTQNENNRSGVSIGIADSDGLYTETSSMLKVLITETSTSGQYTLYANSGSTKGYLYAASSSANQLKTRSEDSDTKSRWTITHDGTGFEVISVNTDVRGEMDMNDGQSGKIFACYSSATNYYIHLYKEFVEEDVVVLTGLAFSEGTSGSIYEGQPLTLHPTYEPTTATYRAVNWSSSSEGVATVADGVITTVSAGTTTITATSTKYPSISASYALTVKTMPVFEKVTSQSSLFDGESVALLTDAGKIATSFNSGKYLNTDSATSVTGGYTKSGAMIFTVRMYGDRFALESGGKFLNYSGTSNAVYLDETTLSSTTKAYSWSLNSTGLRSYDSSNNGRYLRYNSGSPRFACYDNSSMDAVQLYKANDSTMTTNMMADTFLYRELHMRDIAKTDVSEGTACKGDNGYFKKAKAAWEDASFTQAAKNIVLANSDAVARLEAWARANSTTFDSSTGTFGAQVTNNMFRNAIANNNAVIATVVIISVISLSTLCGYFLLRKRKEER